MAEIFANLEDVVIGRRFVEYIPFVGSVYFFKCSAIAHEGTERKHFWKNLADATGFIAMDAILSSKKAEPISTVIFQPVAEPISGKLIEMYNSEKKAYLIQGKLTDEPESVRDYVIVASKEDHPTEGHLQAAERLFNEKVKGIYYFYNSIFVGTLTEKRYAPNGEAIWMVLPDGMYDGARCYFVWKWTKDAAGKVNRPDRSVGNIKFVPKSDKEFVVETNCYYHFRGKVDGIDTMSISIEGNSEIKNVVMKRDYNTKV